MKLGINAFNIRVGGGVTHLVELLSAAEPKDYGFTEVIVWAGTKTIQRLPDRPWLTKIAVSALDKGWFAKLHWTFRVFPKEVLQCDVLFMPGGTYLGRFRPFVTMLQNVLPFDSQENKRYWNNEVRGYVKGLLRHKTQGVTLQRAQGAIFPSHYAEQLIRSQLPASSAAMDCTIYHGVNPDFFKQPIIKPGDLTKQPVKLLYVSSVDLYKHQWQVVKAVKLLRARGVAVHLDLIGPSFSPKAQSLLQQAIADLGADAQSVKYWGNVPYAELPPFYHQADVFVFASSCESISIIVQEAMASGLAIACSDRSAMPEILQDGGIYFDPENPAAIADAVYRLLEDGQLRARCQRAAFQHSCTYQWSQSAAQTFAFFQKVARASSDQE